MKLCHFLLLILFFASPLEAQSISGRVTTDSGDAIAYVNFGIVGKNIGTISTINSITLVLARCKTVLRQNNNYIVKNDIKARQAQ